MNISNDYLFFGNISDNEIPNESEYISQVRGPKYLPWELTVPVTLAYVIIFVTGVIGNVATCIVIVKNPSMQTATNYYLFNLAISDLLLLILGLPHELSEFWEQYPWKWGLGMCKLRAYISEASSYVSVLTIVAFSIERYWAIYHPLRQYGGGLKRSMRCILVVWLIAFFSALPFAVYMNISYVEFPPNSSRYSNDSAICVMQDADIPEFPLYELSCIIFFLMPMLFIGVLYTLICLRIRSDSLVQNVEGSVHGETRQAQSRKAITRMLSAVVIAFFVCWAPFHVQRILSVYKHYTDDNITRWLFPLTGCLYYFSATVNPILYNLMSAKYRNAFKETCYCMSSNHITRVGLSSVKRSSMVCATGSKIESQVFPMRHIGSSRLRNNARTAVQSNSDDGNNDSSPVDRNINETINENCTRELKKSFLIRAKNGRLKCEMPTNETFSKETHI